MRSQVGVQRRSLELEKAETDITTPAGRTSAVLLAGQARREANRFTVRLDEIHPANIDFSQVI